MRLVDYTYYLIFNCSSCKDKLKVDIEIYRIFNGKTGTVFIEKYYRTQVGMYEYHVVSWTVNNPES